MHPFFVIVGYIGSVTLCLSFSPQVVKAYKTKEVKSISTKFLVLQFLTTILWGIYGAGFVLNKDYHGLPIFIANCFIFICLVFLAVAVYRFG